MPRSGGSSQVLDWFDLSVANGVFVKAFDPYSFQMRHSDSARVFGHGGFTSDHYANAKESVLEMTIYGNSQSTTPPLTGWRRIRAIMGKLQPGRDLIFRWYDNPGLGSPKYFYGKVVSVNSGVTPPQTTNDITQDWVDVNFRIRSVDPFIYDGFKLDTFPGSTSPSIRDTQSFLTQVSDTSNDMTFESMSTIEHPPEYLQLRTPTVDGETIVHTLTIPETDTSCSVTIEGNGSFFAYTLWTRFTEELDFRLSEFGGGPTVVNDQIWDGGVPLFPAGGEFHLQHTIEVTVPSGVTDPTSRIVLPTPGSDPRDPTARYMTWWVHRRARIL